MNVSMLRRLAAIGRFALALGAGFVVLPHSAAAATRIWDGGGASSNWSEPANWSGDVVPGLNDFVSFDGTSTKSATIDGGGPQGANINVGILQIAAGYAGTITMAPGVNLRLTVDFNQSEPLSTFVGGSGDLDVDQSFFVTGGTFVAPSGRLLVGANFTRTNGTFQHNHGSVVFDAFSSNISVSGSESFNHLTFNAINQNKTITGGGRLIVLGTLTLADGSITAGAVEAHADVVHLSTFDGGNSTIHILQPAARTITLTAGGSLPNVVLNAPNVVINTIGAGTLKLANVTLQAGSVEQGDVPLSFASSTSFSQSGGTFTGGSGAITGLFRFTLSGGTFTHGSGTLSVSDLFTVSNGSFIGGSGDVDVNQGFTLSGGTFTAPGGRLFLGHHFTHTAGGTFLHNNGTVVLDNFSFSTIDVSGSETFHHLTVNAIKNIGPGDTLIALGTLTLADGSVGGGTISPRGNVVVAAAFDGGGAHLTFAGGADQTFSNAGGINPTGTWTVNKSAGKVTLASHLTLGTTQPLNVTSGTLDFGPAFNLTAGAITIGANGILRNFGHGNLTLGGSLVNNGIFNFNGGGTGCADAGAGDPLLIRSSAAGTARNWSGTGAFSIVDADLKDLNASAVTGGIRAFASTNSGNNTNWIFDPGCPVQITAQPAAQSGCPGSPASFSVGATGDSLTFRWRRNAVDLVDGGNIAGAASATLHVNPATAADGGSYDVVATDRFGVTAASTAATLSILETPAILVQPKSAIACESEPVTFTVAATGDGLTYQWRKDGQPIPGAQGSSFSIPGVANVDSGIYDVLVGGTCGGPFPSATATLTVNAPPRIVGQPVSRDACEGSWTTFSVTATGTDLSFQWRRGGTPVTNGPRVAGANDATLSIDSLVALDADTYDVVVGGACGPQAVSDPVSLTVTACSGGGLITFEDTPGVTAMTGGNSTPVPVEARLGSQLQNSHGVSFSSVAGYVATVSLGSAWATSGRNGIGGVDSLNALDYGAPVVITFSLPGSPSTPAVTDFVSVRGDRDTAGGWATMEAFSATGALIGSVTVPDGGSGLTLSLAVPDIHRIRLTQTDADIAFDDLTFNPLSEASVPGSARPTAHAGDDRPVRPGQTVMLDGSASSDDNTATADLAFAWTLASRPAGSAAALVGGDTMRPSFTADLPGDYIAALTVTDADGLASDPDTVVVSSHNTPPVADAGVDAGTFVGRPVALDGSASRDADADPLAFWWTLSTPAGSSAALTGERTAFASFTPDVPGIYTAMLVVDDGFGGVSSDSVVVSAITAAEYVADQTASALNLVASLSLAQVTTKGNRQALQNFLSQAIAALQADDLDLAWHKLTQAIERTDGCVQRGSVDTHGSGRDWIVDCAAQVMVHEKLAAALDALRP